MSAPGHHSRESSFTARALRQPKEASTAVAPSSTLRRACLFGLAGVLAGCVTPTALRPEGEAGRRSLSRTGRFVINVRQPEAAPEVVQGGFAWLDHGGRLTLDLTSPLGASLARLEVAQDGRAVLTEANGTVTQAPSADELMWRVVGVGVPVASLRDWLAGDMAPGAAMTVAERDDAGRPVRFDQAGWQVQVTASDAEGPLRMRLVRARPGEPEIEVRLAMQAVAAAS